jgi:hypothetical protein
MAIPSPEEIAAALRFPGSRPIRADDAPSADDTQPIDEPNVPIWKTFDRRDDKGGKPSGQPEPISEAITANAFIQGRLLALRGRYQNDSDFNTIEKRWGAEANKGVEDGLALVSSDRWRQIVRKTVAAPLAQERSAIQAQALRGVADDHATARQQYVTFLANNLGFDPNDATTTGMTHAYHNMVDDAVARNLLTSEQALAEKRATALKLCAAHYFHLGNADPSRAISELESPDCPDPLVQHLPARTKDWLVARADDVRQLRQIDAERTPRIEAQERERASDEAEGAYAAKLLQDDPTATLAGIYQDDALTIDAKRRLLVMGKAALDPEPPAEVSNAIALGLRDRIRRSDGDPDKITTHAPLIEAFNDHKLTRKDFEFVEKLLTEPRTPDGEALAKNQQDFTESVKSQTGPSASIDPGHTDPAAVSQHYDLEREVDQKVERARKDGKDPNDLFDPSKPEFLGRPGALRALGKETLAGVGPNDGAAATSPTPRANPPSQPPASTPASNFASSGPASLEITSADATRGDAVDRHIAPELATDPNTAAPHHTIADAFEAAAQRMRQSAQHRQEAAEFKSTEVPADDQARAAAPPQGPVEPGDAKQPNAELPPDQPSISEHATNALQHAFVAAGLKPDHAGYLAEGLVDVLSTFTPLGIPLAVDDIRRAARRGDLIGTLAAAAALVPGGRLVKLAAKVPLRALSKGALRAHARTTFEAAHPHLKGKVYVHHAKPLALLDKYPGRFTEEEIKALKNLRGIPNKRHPQLHLSEIHGKWNRFYKGHPHASRRRILRMVKEIDKEFGLHFLPPH